MPSALETLVKILKLEREQGCQNTAVIGGLAAFGQNWSKDAHAQARKPEHHILVDELADLLHRYDQIENRVERKEKIGYMMDRITGRVPPPAEYQAKLSAHAEVETQQRPPAPPKPNPNVNPNNAPRDRSPQANANQNAPYGQRPPAPRPQPQKQQGRPPQPHQQHQKPSYKRRDESDDGGYDDDMRGRDDMQFRGTPGVMDIPAQPRLARPPRNARKQIDPATAAEITSELGRPVTKINGVGERMASSFDKLKVRKIHDLLEFYPRDYDDYTKLLPINKLQPNEKAVIIATVRQTEVRIGRGGRKDFYALLDDGSALLGVTFFGQHYLSRNIKPGQQICARGQPRLFNGRLTLENPEWEHVEADNLVHVGIVPVYPLTEGLKAGGLRRLIKSAITHWANQLPDYVPEATLERAELADLGWALRNIHFPEGWDHLEHARRRLAFDELLLLQLTVLGTRREWQAVPADSLNIDDGFMESFIESVFPYLLTGAQRRAIDDIRRDITKPVPMNRLLQGDVGAGKTAVATAAMALAVANGKQAAIMAPTSILAEQHYRNLTAAFDRFPGDRQPRVVLLTGALTSAEREENLAAIANGSAEIIVGTHALIQEGVEFHDLALAVIDEQHRFGTEQRGSLRGKGKNPHLLVMTATPIPRTLALTIHADLDLSILDEMPPGRLPIKTKVIEPIQRERIWNFVEGQLEQGRQAFVVHPLVEQSEKIEAVSAMEAYDTLKKVFYDYEIGLLHGRMKPAEKDEAMAAFSRGFYNVLVTTSVAEVGVDVPNASIIVIEGANRFGLAQLHQFRGRVGRGQHASFCLLVPDMTTPESMERLSALETINDGFRLAEIDWKLRGAGDLVGTRQSGRSLFKLADYITPELVELAQREARTIYEEDPDLSQPQHRLLAQRVQMLRDERSDVS